MRDRYNSYSKEEKEKICKEFTNSKLSYRDFAIEHNLKLGTLAGWVSEYRTRIRSDEIVCSDTSTCVADENEVNDINNREINEKNTHEVYSVEYKIAMIKEFENSNMSLRKFSKIHNIPKSTFIKWNKKYSNRSIDENDDIDGINSFIDVSNCLVTSNSINTSNSFLPSIIDSNENSTTAFNLIRIRYCNSEIEVDETQLIKVLEAIKRVEIQ